VFVCDCVCHVVGVGVGVRVCVCVCEREKERATKRAGHTYVRDDKIQSVAKHCNKHDSPYNTKGLLLQQKCIFLQHSGYLFSVLYMITFAAIYFFMYAHQGCSATLQQTCVRWRKRQTRLSLPPLFKLYSSLHHTRNFYTCTSRALQQTPVP